MSNTIYSDKIIVNCPLVCDENGYYHLIYQVTNKKNGKIYVGKHTTKNPYDNYLGSGKLINQAIKKYGIENFTKEILYCFTNEKEAYLKEEEIVNLEFVKSENTYNIILGGHGLSSEDMRGEKNPQYGKRGELSPNFKKQVSQETRNKLVKNHQDFSGERNPMFGKKHSPKTLLKMSKWQKGKNNPRAKIVIKKDEFGNIVTEYGCVRDCRERERFSWYKLKKIISERILYNGFYFEFKPQN